MRRILLLAYHFPPIGGAGTQRNAKLARYLPELGYELTVITGPGVTDYRWTPADDTLTRDVHESVRVCRLAGPEPPRPTGLRGSVERWLRFRTQWERWWEREAVSTAVEVGRGTDVVYASLNPFSTARTAISIARHLRAPLVLDLEDPWALDEMLPHESRVHAWLELRAMRRTLGAADAVVMNTPEAAARVVTSFPELSEIPVRSIVNGFDAADFRPTPPRPDDGVFRIVHTGSLHHWAARRSSLRRLLGGQQPGVNLLTRSLVSLIAALDQLLGIRPDLNGRIELHLAGRVTDDDRATFAGSTLVREHGFLTHLEATALMQSADLLFLPMHDVPRGRRVGIVPCKTYEYLGSGRPILAAVPDGDARDFLEAAGNAYICRPDDVDGLAAAVESAIERAANGPAPPPDPDLLERLERQRLTQDLADFLESLATASPSRALAPEPA